MTADLDRPLGYRELDTTTVCDVAQPFLAGTARSAEEVGDGNLNLIFRVRSSEASVIVKQALPYLRLAGEGWPLTLDRARIEAEALRVYSHLAPERLPKVHSFEPELAATVMEDLSGHRLWRQSLMDGDVRDGVAAQLGEFCARVLIGTSAVLMPSEERVVLQLRFSGRDLCAITEDLVFTAPFSVADSNRIDPAIADAAEQLRTDRPLKQMVAFMRFCFASRAEALIHGDLHTGSVMVRDDRDPDARVIDPEFAVYGPIGFDLGLLVANLAMSWHSHHAAGRSAAATAVAGEAAAFWQSFTVTSSSLWPQREPWFPRFLHQVLDDCGRYAGLEMARRIVGMAKVADVETLPDDARTRAAGGVLTGAKTLLLGGPPRDFAEVWDRAVADVTYN